MPTADRVTVLIATRDRQESLLRTLDAVSRLAERPAIVVVDDGSTDGTPAAVAGAFPGVQLTSLPTPTGVTAARNIGIAVASTPYVALTDDDSWWAPGALAHAVEELDRAPSVALLAARVLVGAEQRLDATCARMACSPLPRLPNLPGPRVLGFVGCAAVVRRDVCLRAGGFVDRYVIGGEEDALALALARVGGQLVYVDDVVAYHHPAHAGRDGPSRRRQVARNDLHTTWRHRRGRGLARARSTCCDERGATAPSASGGRRVARRPVGDPHTDAGAHRGGDVETDARLARVRVPAAVLVPRSRAMARDRGTRTRGAAR
ncbi:MAG: glycosyltransferase [Actinobacteria bacterium]|nr:glycosyltransferase [Actinomycetota bacterium]